MLMNSVIFREYDIRGVYNTDFDKDFAYTLGRAFISYLKKRTGQSGVKVTLGHDARLSSPEIAKSMAEGFKASGAHVIHLGMVTSPISYFSTFTVEGVIGGIMVTGSHNPPDHNGFKISFNKTTIHGDEIKELERIINKREFVEGQGSEETLDILTPYVERYRKEFSSLKEKFSDFPVVVDCGNGAAGTVIRRMYEAVGLKPTILFEQPDGRFPNHHPDPTVEKNLQSLKQEVARKQARVGIGFDGDADRIGLVDDKGRFILGDEMMAVMAYDVIRENPGAKIIGDVKCSDRMFDFIRKNGGEAIMWKTGHSLIKNKVKEVKAPFGGEMSGHVFYADRNYGYDDALYAGLRVIEILAKSGKTISDLLKDLPPAFNTPEIRIDTTEEKKHAIVAKLKERFSNSSADYKTDLLDGIRVSFKDGWALARASNTQPVLVLRFESITEAGLKRIYGSFASVVEPMLGHPIADSH